MTNETRKKLAKAENREAAEPQETWRTKAREILPEVRQAWEIDDSETPMQAWIQISLAFSMAYDEPRNEDLIRRIYDYADWCLEHGGRTEKASTDLLTCVAVCFYEHIPIHEASRLDMPRWFTREDIVLMKNTFSYHLNPDEYERLLELFMPLHNTKRQTQHKHPKN